MYHLLWPHLGQVCVCPLCHVPSCVPSAVCAAPSSTVCVSCVCCVCATAVVSSFHFHICSVYTPDCNLCSKTWIHFMTTPTGAYSTSVTGLLVYPQHVGLLPWSTPPRVPDYCCMRQHVCTVCYLHSSPHVQPRKVEMYSKTRVRTCQQHGVFHHVCWSVVRTYVLTYLCEPQHLVILPSSIDHCFRPCWSHCPRTRDRTSLWCVSPVEKVICNC